MVRYVGIADKKIGKDYRPFIVAEMSANHNHSLERALAIVEAAAAAGAHAVKLQTYTADTITIDVEEGDFYIDDQNSLWRGTSLYRLYQNAYTPWEWHKQIFNKCEELGMIGFSTPFDETAVDFLENLGVPCYKIASFENNHIPLIRKIAQTGKPIFMSTGMATMVELGESIEAAQSTGCEDMILLKCTSSYPASPENSNIATIPYLGASFKCEVGLSDHSLGIGVAIAGIALGATVIEKHLTLSRADGGVDSVFSMEPDELKALVVESERAWQSLGEIQDGPTEDEKKSMLFRRSIYITKDMGAGEVFTEDNLRVIRPGFGLPPKHYEGLLGKKVSMNAKKGTPLSWGLVSGLEAGNG